MPKFNLPIIDIIRTLEDGSFFAEALFFPETLRFHTNDRKALESLHANIIKLLDEMPAVLLHQRMPAGEPEIIRRSFTISPPAEQVKAGSWRRPLTLEFDIVHWSHGDQAHIAYIPALGIEVDSTKPPTFQAIEKMLPQQINDALKRTGAINSLGSLLRLQRTVDTRIEISSIEAIIPTPKQLVVQDLETEGRKESALAETSIDLTKENLSIAFEADEFVARLAEALTGKSPRSVLLVGASGVGKTAVFYELARRRREFHLGHTPFWSTNGSRLIAGMTGFGQWQERCQKLWREAAQERAILHLGNLVELMEVGKYEGNSLGIAAFLRPYISRGDVIAVAECTNEQLSLIERDDPRLLEAFHQIRIPEPSIGGGGNILLSFAFSHAKGIEIDLEAIERVNQLHRRYATYSAFPGRPIRFLRNLLNDLAHRGDPSSRLTIAEVNAAFSRESGLPQVFLDEREKLDFEDTRRWFSSRLIGQPEVIDFVVDLLATIKAGLTRPRKPIASLLFVGPTGVGKTEMAKALAEFLFQDRSRLIRFDMSEYATPPAVDRLISGSAGAEGLLTAKIREQPFSVVLFDEFEKAHPLFFDLLLQALGDGRLTDARGKVADFCNAVVIMTSNLGAESFQRGLTGFRQAQADREAAVKHFTRAVRQTLRPEMFNRIDRIIPFTPLDKESVLRIAEREIEMISDRDGIKLREINLSVEPAAIEYFALKGYDARYGARPLKRLIERELLAPLSEKLNQTNSPEGMTVRIRREESGLKFDLQYAASSTEPAEPESGGFNDQRTLHFIARISEMRRDSSKLIRCAATREIQNEIYNLERAEKRSGQSRERNADDSYALEKLRNLRNLSNRIEAFAEEIQRYEHSLLLDYYNRAESDKRAQADEASGFDSQLEELLLSIYTLNFRDPDKATLAIFSEDCDQLYQLAEVYYEVLKSCSADFTAVQFAQRRQARGRRPSKAEEKQSGENGAEEDASPLKRIPIREIKVFLREPRTDTRGIGFSASFPYAFPILILEAGLHTFTRGRKNYKCLVDVAGGAAADYSPPEGIEQHGSIGFQFKRRGINFDTGVIDDARIGRGQLQPSHSLHALTTSMIREALKKRIRSILVDGSM